MAAQRGHCVLPVTPQPGTSRSHGISKAALEGSCQLGREGRGLVQTPAAHATAKSLPETSQASGTGDSHVHSSGRRTVPPREAQAIRGCPDAMKGSGSCTRTPHLPAGSTGAHSTLPPRLTLPGSGHPAGVSQGTSATSAPPLFPV